MSTLFNQAVEEEAGLREAEVSPLERRNKESLQHQWRQAFCPEVKLQTGKWLLGQFDWHAFSYKMAKSVLEVRAETAYEARLDRELVILPMDIDRSSFAYKWVGCQKPDFARFGLDMSISDPQFSWTMVFSHEADYGPYFSQREWHDRAREQLQELP